MLGRHLLESRFTGIHRDSQGVPQRTHRVTCLVAAPMFPSKAPQAADAQTIPMGMTNPMLGMGMMNPMAMMNPALCSPPRPAGYNQGPMARITGSAAQLGALPSTRLQDCVAFTDDRLDSTFTAVFEEDLKPLLMLLFIFAGLRPTTSIKKLRASTYLIIVNLRIL